MVKRCRTGVNLNRDRGKPLVVAKEVAVTGGAWGATQN